MRDAVCISTGICTGPFAVEIVMSCPPVGTGKCGTSALPGSTVWILEPVGERNGDCGGGSISGGKVLRSAYDESPVTDPPLLAIIVGGSSLEDGNPSVSDSSICAALLLLAFRFTSSAFSIERISKDGLSLAEAGGSAMLNGEVTKLLALLC